MSLRILVLGAGATGGYFGGRLLEAAAAGKADVDVTFLVRPARAQVLATHGLRVRGVNELTLPVRTVDATTVRPEYDLVLLSCKAYDLESSLDAIAPAVGANTFVLPILNGLMHFAALEARFGAARVLGGCCYLAASIDGDGVIRQFHRSARITYGARPGQPAAARAIVEQLDAAFAATQGVEAWRADDVLQEIWEKYVFLASLAGMTCLMRAAVGDIVGSEGGATLTERMLSECVAAATAAGHPPRPERLAAARAQLLDAESAATASMLRDLEAGGRIESEQIVGDMLRRARAAGSDGVMLAAAWVHLQARDRRRARETRASRT